MAYRIKRWFSFIFALHAAMHIDTILATEMNNNTTNTYLRTEHFLKYFRTISTLQAVQNILGFVDVNAALKIQASSLNVSQECFDDLNVTAKALEKGERWALQMVDSFGKPGSDVLSGQLKWLGSYDECIQTTGSLTAQNSTPNRRSEILGRYCKLSVAMSATNAEPASTEIELGICIPHSCSVADIQHLLTIGILDAAMVQHIKIACEEKKLLEGGAVAVICFLSGLGLLITVATTYDVIKFHLLSPSMLQRAENGNSSQDKVEVITGDCLANEIEIETVFDNGGFIPEAEQDDHSSDTGSSPSRTEETNSSVNSDSPKSEHMPKGMPETLLVSFSLVTNVQKIFAAPENNADRFAVLHGIKFLSMSWIILGHSFLFVYHYTENVYSYAVNEGSALSFMPISFTSIAVDTFFAVSGFLVGHLNLVEMQRVNGARHFNWLLFFTHRFWRLTPTYMAVLMVFSTLMKHWSKGPFALDGEMFDNCQQSWWTNLLYVNNFVKLDQMCMGWTWYLANDMQFYLMSPLLFVSLFYHRLIGIGICMAILMINMVSTAAIFTEYDFHSQEVFRAVPWLDDGEYAKHVYMPCYTRVGAYVVGLLTGYLLFIQNFKCRLPKILQLVLWIVSITVCTLVVYGLHRKNNDPLVTEGASVTYEALNRICWSIAVCWIIFACVTGNGGWISSVLSWRPLVPLGRLTFCAYLIHPLVMLTLYRNRRVPVHLSNFEMVSIWYILQ